MDVFSNILYILLGVVSFALIAFFAWATWSGSRNEDTGWADESELPEVPEQPGSGPPPPTEASPPPAEPAADAPGRA